MVDTFVDLPAALVEELLGKTPILSRTVVAQLSDRRAQRERLRERLRSLGLLGAISELPRVPTGTSCGIDGSVAIERLLAHDLLVAGALAVEGLTPPSNERYWPEPRHEIWVELEPHADLNDVVARGIMAALEVELATRAPHDVVFLDGSLATSLIAFDQALRAITEFAEHTTSSRFFFSRLPEWLAALLRILEAASPQQCWIGIPKYTSRREIASMLGIDDPIDDRALLTTLLVEGEFTRPVPLHARRPHGFGIALFPPEQRATASTLVSRLLAVVTELRVIYVRPHRWLPALRLELHRAVADDPHRLARVLEVVRFQCARGALVEPFPLFLADRMVRHLRRATRALRHAIREAAAREYPLLEDVFVMLESYRSEGYRAP